MMRRHVLEWHRIVFTLRAITAYFWPSSIQDAALCASMVMASCASVGINALLLVGGDHQAHQLLAPRLALAILLLGRDGRVLSRARVAKRALRRASPPICVQTYADPDVTGTGEPNATRRQGSATGSAVAAANPANRNAQRGQRSHLRQKQNTGVPHWRQNRCSPFSTSDADTEVLARLLIDFSAHVAAHNPVKVCHDLPSDDPWPPFEDNDFVELFSRLRAPVSCYATA
jgi:hypothetical protein